MPGLGPQLLGRLVRRPSGIIVAGGRRDTPLSVVGVTRGNDTSQPTSRTINYPAGAAAGDTVVAVLVSQNGATPWNLGGGGWTDLIDPAANKYVWFNVGALRVAWRTVGAEGSFSTDQNGTASAMVWNVYVLRGASGVEIAHAAAFAAASYDPPALTPSWGSQECVWIAGAAYGVNDNVQTPPTNYSDWAQNRWVNAAGRGLSSGRRQLAAASENPGAIGNSPNNTDGRVFTIAVRKAP